MQSINVTRARNLNVVMDMDGTVDHHHESIHSKFLRNKQPPLRDGCFIKACCSFEIVICLNHFTFVNSQFPNSFAQTETDEVIAPVRNIDWL